MKKGLIFSSTLLAFFFFALIWPSKSLALEGSVLGIHILSPNEVSSAKQLFDADQNKNDWHYVTVPLSLDDLHNHDEWQKFCDYSKQQHLVPIVRLVTRFQNGVWQVPTKKDVVDEITFLSQLDWPEDERFIIVFNEVNHASEWGGSVDPQGYAEVLRFTSDWAKSEDKNYKILPAAMDLSAPNGGSMREAFSYLDAMYGANPEIFSYVDYWNSHSYPNPGFSASPQASGKMSVRGFQSELAYLRNKTGHDFETFITETGWVDNAATNRWLDSYYAYVAKEVWSDPHVKGVTPFVLQGDPGPFSGFSFINRFGQPTHQYEAYQKVIRGL